MFENITVVELSRMIRKKDVKPSEVCADFLARANKTEPKINAFITHTPDNVIQRAKELDEEIITPETSPVFGLPIAVKDNICTIDMPTTCASKMLENFRPTYDATVVSRLKEQGAVIMGKTNMDEFAMGASGETSAYGRVYNPHDLTRSPGGSSCGSAAAVAAGSVPFSLGSDTGGSIRQPASFCGLVGYKPSYGAVSRYGLLAYANSFDQIGSICRTVSDVALLTTAIAGHDTHDSTSNPAFVADFSSIEEFNVKGKKIGILKECFANGIDDEVYAAVMSVKKTYESLGAEIIEISIPSIENSLPAYYTIALAEASSGLSKLDGIRFGYRTSNYTDMDSLYINSRTEGFGDEVKKRIIIGTYLLSAGNYEVYYKKSRIIQSMIRDDFSNAFKECDILLTPVTPKTAYPFGQKETDPAALYLGDICTVPVNMAGLPAISIPCGKDSENLPIGVQLIGNKFKDADLLGFACAFERENNLKFGG